MWLLLSSITLVSPLMADCGFEGPCPNGGNTYLIVVKYKRIDWLCFIWKIFSSFALPDGLCQVHPVWQREPRRDVLSTWHLLQLCHLPMQFLLLSLDPASSTNNHRPHNHNQHNAWTSPYNTSPRSLPRFPGQEALQEWNWRAWVL